jgi:Asp-tRNA(Asn)/Glu-tRNA(Gln) amidotransferase A subunit family amidase
VSSPYWHHSIEAQVAAVRGGLVTAQELAQHVRDAIREREPTIHAWVELTRDLDDQPTTDAVKTAPLEGISIGVKDLIDVAGLPTRAGSTITSDLPKPFDAPCVARFRELGAVVQGKTVTTEFGYFEPGSTRNPYSYEHTPGGSSSGSAAAVGAGVVPLALGTQTAGSLTRPASYCGAAGLVLSQGATSLRGVTGLSESLDSLGILARSTDDLRYVYSAFAGRGWSEPVRSGFGTSSVLIWRGSDLDEIEPSMQQLLNVLPELLGSIGIDTAPLEWDDHVSTLADDHAVVMSFEAAATLGDTFDRARDALSPALRTLVEYGRTVDAQDHAAALIRRDRSSTLLDNILGKGTVVVGAAALGPAPRGLAATGSPVLSRPWQLLGSPVVTVPGARTADGMPLGLQVIGLPGREMQLLDLATRLEPALRSAAAPL